MNELQIFNNSEFGEIRTVEVNGKPYFVASDIAKALGYAKPQNAISQHCRGALKQGIGVTTGLKADGSLAIQNVEMLIIPEGDIYRLIIKSQLPTAQKFESWVFDEVLPTIRRHGVYAIDDVMQNPDMLITALQNLKAERERTRELQATVQQMDKVICDMTPKVDYADRILSSADAVLVTQIAQDYGMSAKTFNSLLGKLGIQHKVGEQWILYAEHQGKGYVKTKTHEFTKPNGTVGTKLATVWLQKGRMFLYHKLKENGILPIIEV